MAELKTGSVAPEFTLHDQNGDKVWLTDFRGKTVVVYFYPKDDTPGCTKEACDFRDYEKDFTRLNVAVLGVSKDTKERHMKFVEKFNLPFCLLTDENLHVMKTYGVWRKKKLRGKDVMGVVRSTFVINAWGRIDKIYTKVKVAGHVAALLDKLKKELR